MSPAHLQRLYLQIILTQCISLKQGVGVFVSVWVFKFRNRCTIMKFSSGYTFGQNVVHYVANKN